MAKNIAVLMGHINMENQKHILEGMIDVVKNSENNLYVFTSYASRNENKESIQGAFQIMELPDFEYFDGAIVAVDTITYAPCYSYIMDKLRASKIPAITLDKKVEGYSCLQTSSYHAQYDVIEHLIKEKGCRDILYVRGPENYGEAEVRFRAYGDALKDNDIPFREEYVYVGNFALESGFQTAIRINMDGWHPDAIACANDNMAIGVLEYFKTIGLHAPEDYLLVGFDNGESARYSAPPITSVDKSPYELGRKAIEGILSIIDGADEFTEFIPAEVVRRESSDCAGDDEGDIKRLKYKYTQSEIYNTHLAEMINSNLAEFSGLHSPDEVAPILKETIQKTSLRSFYLCLCDREQVFVLPETNMGSNFDLQQVNMDYTEKMDLPLALEYDAINSYKPFYKGMVLPKEIRERSGGGNYYVVTPLFFQNCCYGYCVSGNDKLALMNNLYYSWLNNIGVAYENIRKWMLLEDAVIKLNNVWSYDMLTKLYNRAGFFYEAKTVLEHLKLQDSQIFLLFSDVDGLKKVNDNQGHEMGDLLIKEIAACIQENVSEDMYAMRYGGDEFVIFGSYENEDEVECLLKGIHASMALRNESGNLPFKLSASIGVSKHRARDIKELSDLIETADADMYEKKRKKREERERRDSE